VFYRIIVWVCIPPILYDWFTSFIGAVAALNLGANSPLPYWGLPLVVSLTALAINALTTDIFGEREVNPWLGLFWFVCLAYDAYTTYLGVAHIASGYGMTNIVETNLIHVLLRLPIETSIFLAFASAVLVASPMFCFWVEKKINQPVSSR
jgi:hypothetical protein